MATILGTTTELPAPKGEHWPGKYADMRSKVLALPPGEWQIVEFQSEDEKRKTIKALRATPKDRVLRTRDEGLVVYLRYE
jgi:hypothetical protein